MRRPLITRLVGALIVASITCGCNGAGQSGLEKAITEFDKLKAGMSMDEVTALLGKPSKRTDGPQVSYPGQSKGQVVEVLSGNRLWSSRDPVEAEIVSLISSGVSVNPTQPANFGELPAPAASGKVNWLYAPSKSNASRIVLGFVDGKLASADLFRVAQTK